MFQLSEISQMVRVPPWLFGKTLNEAVSEELNRKLSNKVVFNLGLCISLYDIMSLGDSYIFPGDGSSHTRVSFRFIVFRPCEDEIIEGVLKSADSEGIRVSIGFFDDIYVKKEFLMSNSAFDETEKAWYWNYVSDESTYKLYMDVGEKIRFRVLSEQFTDTTPSGPTKCEEEPEKQKICPYIIYGTINDQGLGMLSWWNTEEEEEEEEEEEGEELEEEMEVAAVPNQVNDLSNDNHLS